MVERDILDKDVLSTLRDGHLAEPPTLTERREWKLKFTKRLRGRRDVGVIVVILNSVEKLFVKTVEWED